MAPSSVSKLQFPSSTWPWWGNFYGFKKKATRRQSTNEINIYGLLAILVLLSLLPQDCWLVVALGQIQRCHGRWDGQQFCFCCSMRDARVRKRFLIDLREVFWRKGAPTLDLKKYCLYFFLHEYIKLGR
jgi:hypothetical protein